MSKHIVTSLACVLVVCTLLSNVAGEAQVVFGVRFRRHLLTALHVHSLSWHVKAPSKCLQALVQACQQSLTVDWQHQFCTG